MQTRVYPVPAWDGTLLRARLGATGSQGLLPRALEFADTPSIRRVKLVTRKPQACVVPEGDQRSTTASRTETANAPAVPPVTQPVTPSRGPTRRVRLKRDDLDVSPTTTGERWPAQREQVVQWARACGGADITAGAARDFLRPLLEQRAAQLLTHAVRDLGAALATECRRDPGASARAYFEEQPGLDALLMGLLGDRDALKSLRPETLGALIGGMRSACTPGPRGDGVFEMAIWRACQARWPADRVMALACGWMAESGVEPRRLAQTTQAYDRALADAADLAHRPLAVLRDESLPVGQRVDRVRMAMTIPGVLRTDRYFSTRSAVQSLDDLSSVQKSQVLRAMAQARDAANGQARPSAQAPA